MCVHILCFKQKYQLKLVIFTARGILHRDVIVIRTPFLCIRLNNTCLLM